MGEACAVRKSASLKPPLFWRLMRSEHRGVVEAVLLMTLDHTLKGCAVDAEQSRCRLFVAARRSQHARDVAALNDREREQLLAFIRLFGRQRIYLLSNRRSDRRAFAYA